MEPVWVCSVMYCSLLPGTQDVLGKTSSFLLVHLQWKRPPWSAAPSVYRYFRAESMLLACAAWGRLHVSSPESLPDTPLSLLKFAVYLANEWIPAGLACFLCLLASRSLSVVSVISEPAQASNIKSWLSASVGGQRCMAPPRARSERLGSWNLAIPSRHWQSVGMQSTSCHLLLYK